MSSCELSTALLDEIEQAPVGTSTPVKKISGVPILLQSLCKLFPHNRNTRGVREAKGL